MWHGIWTKKKGVWHPYSRIKANFETQRLNILQFFRLQMETSTDAHSISEG